MNDPTTDTPNLWALLIGIDCYIGRTMAGIPNYPHLGGCVNDILLMDEFLRTRLTVPEGRITKLTASGSGSEPTEDRQFWPTKANIVAAFQDLADKAQPGDQVYVHYAGHGGRAVTIYPEIKGDEGLDESLVPTDYGRIENLDAPEDRYVRDLELGTLLQGLVDNELVVTIALDSCHSGGATRAARAEADDDVAVRGGVEPDMVPRTPSDLVRLPEAMTTSWEEAGGMRSAEVASGWLPNPEGYTMIAACRALELAREYQVAPGKRHGALTYWLWHALQTPGLTWEMVHQQVVARVHGKFSAQTPQLQGVGNRKVFGGVALAMPEGVNVLEVQGERIRLNVGQAGNAAVGAQYFIYPPGTTDFKERDQRLAVAEIEQVISGMESWARIVRRLRDDAIEPGAQALLFDPGTERQRSVRLMPQTEEGRAPSDAQEEARTALSMAIAEAEARFVRLASEGEAASFHVAVSEEPAFSILDADLEPLPHLASVPGDDPAEVVYRLIHLAKYYNVLEMDNPDAVSRLAGRLEVKLMKSEEEPFDDPGGIPTVLDSEQIYFLHIRNLFEPMDEPSSDASWYIEEMRRRTMNVTLLNLASDYSITRLIPRVTEAVDQIELGPGETLKIPRGDLPGQPMGLPALASGLPEGADETIDILKVFATTETTSYNSLQLPALDDMASRAALVGVPKAQEPEREWITTQVQVRVVRR